MLFNFRFRISQDTTGYPMIMFMVLTMPQKEPISTFSKLRKASYADCNKTKLCTYSRPTRIKM